MADEAKIFWKLYGEASCEAILDSEGGVLVLHHDMRNNLQAVVTHEEIICNHDYPTPYGPRAPPILNNPDLISFAQSLTWQSKQMDPTGLIWFGARYYSPLEGRFLSPDPVSHPVCLDLYTYANGDPINNVDPDGRFFSAVYKTVPPKNINEVNSPLPTVAFNDAFEEQYALNDRSHRYDLSDLGRPELPYGLGVGSVNGMGNDFEFARGNAIHISDIIGGYNIHGAYGATMGFRRDLEACKKARNHEDTGRVRYIHEVWNKFFDRYPDGYFLQYSHSRGTLDVSNALLCYPEERRQRITNAAIAPGGYIYSETCAKVTHYRVPFLNDFVPYNDSAGAKREMHTIITLESDQDAPWHDHSIRSPTYRSCIKDEFQRFIQNRGKRNE